MTTIEIVLVVIVVIQLIGIIVFITKTTDSKRNTYDMSEDMMRLRQELSGNIQSSMKQLGEIISINQKQTDELQSRKFIEIDKNIMQKQEALSNAVLAQFQQMEARFKTFEYSNEQKMENIRTTMKEQLSSIQKDNNEKLEEMRKTVDEKLQKTLEERMTQSFQLVSQRLEQVYKGLGEMQTLAEGVGDLKKVLSNVKTRGILGEIQLGSILEEILAPEQYAANIATKPNSRNVVEYAVKLPGKDNQAVYLPIDSKFPADAYMQLQEAYDSCSKEKIDSAATVMIQRIKSFAKDIRDKYIEPPYTTDFGILFLPFEGLYAEAVNRGLVEILQREYKINLTGPSTMAAMLNSLQMGFKTLAIQKRSSEVWDVLGAVKTEFDKFGNVLMNTQQRLEQANKELDKLVGVRTRQIQRKLSSIEKMDELKSNELLNVDYDVDDLSDS